MPAHRRVILLVESTSSYGRGCLRGIARYAQAHGGWTFLRHIFRTTTAIDAPTLRAWRGDGVIARIEEARMAAVIRELGLPTVDLRGSIGLSGVPGVFTDDPKVVDLAIEHFASNGLSRLAFCGYHGVDFAAARQAAFVKAVGSRGDVYKPPASQLEHGFGTVESQRNPADTEAIADWLEGLEKPVGVLACNDTRGLQVLEACDARGLRVPYDVAVVGVDDDDVLCELSTPSLSSVAPNVEAIGFDAADLLDRLMDGQSPPTEPLLTPPIAVEARESSDAIALADPKTIKAVKYIRSHVADGINVGDVLTHSGMSRSTLERRFVKHLECTPHDYIIKCRIDLVKRLLVGTRYDLDEIVERTSFTSRSYLTSTFHRHTGQTPGAYRRANG